MPMSLNFRRNRILIISACTTLALMVIVPTVFAEDDIHIMYVETNPSQERMNMTVNEIRTAIYSPVQQSVVIAIYLQDSEMQPLGVTIFKTTVLAGVTPIETGWSVPDYAVGDRTVYINIFKDTTLTMPIAPEFSEVWA